MKHDIIAALENAGVSGAIELTKPPKAEMGDFAFACFALAKELGKNPAEAAIELAGNLAKDLPKVVQEVKAFGPYVNFFLNPAEIAASVFGDIATNANTFGVHQDGKDKTVIVEFGCPNPLKAFHLGHLKNLITGESICRILKNSGYTVIRVNYQGDVGMHIGKALWGIFDWKDQFESARELPVKERVEFLGKAYAHGAQHFESGDDGKQDVIQYNDAAYERTDEQIMSIYMEARQWSLDYFDTIYDKLGASFDEFYFESDMFKRGVEIVREYQEKGTFRESEGAIIFPGSEHGLHDRVFINSKGFPTYEAKELALAEVREQKHPGVPVIHVVGKDQTEYFKVVFAAMREMGWQQGERDSHRVGGYLQLKGEESMSSRKGNVVTGDRLLEIVRERVAAAMQDSETSMDHGDATDDVIDKVTDAALTYGMLKADVGKDVAFDLQASISTTGDSGPYLLYIVARINSILQKSGVNMQDARNAAPDIIAPQESQLLLMLSEFPQITAKATDTQDPSHIARYLFSLAQGFNSFYEHCPVLKEEDESKRVFRLNLIQRVHLVMTRGLSLLGIESVEHM